MLTNDNIKRRKYDFYFNESWKKTIGFLQADVPFAAHSFSAEVN